MYFGVCFFCVLLASEIFVTAMPLPSFRNVLETQQIKDKKTEDFYASPQIISLEGFQKKGDYDTLYKSVQTTNNAENSPTSENRGSSNEAVGDDSASFSSLFLESPKSKLHPIFKRTGESNVKKEKDYTSDYIHAFVQDRSTNKLIIPVKTLRKPYSPVKSSSATIPLSEVKHVAHGTADQKNIPPRMSSKVVQPFDDKLRKSHEEGQNTLKERKMEGTHGRTARDVVASSFPLRTSQQSYQNNDEQHPLGEGELERSSLRRKQRNSGAFWRKRDMPVLGYDMSRMLQEPQDENLLQNDVMYGLESSTQYSFVPNPHIFSYGSGRHTFPDVGSINSPEVNEDDEYVPNLPLNSIQGNVAVQNYQQNDQAFQLSRPYDHNSQPLSSLTNSANDIPSNPYLTANSYQSEIMPGLPIEPSDYLAPSSSDEDTVSLNKYLPENDNIGFKSQEVLPRMGEIKYPTENHDKDYEKKYSYNDAVSNILNENDGNIYPGLFTHNSYVGDNVVPGLSDSFPSENVAGGEQIAYSNYKKRKNFLNNKSYEDYSSNKEIQEKYVEGENHIDNNRGYYPDTEIPNSLEQRYSYNYPGILKQISDNKNYQGVSAQLLHNPDINNIEIRDSAVFPPVNFMSHSKSGELSPSFRHFTSDVRPLSMESDLPRKSQYELRKNIRENVIKRDKKPRKYASVRRNSQMSPPYTRDNEYVDFHPRQYRKQDSMRDYDNRPTDSDNDGKNQTKTKIQREFQYETKMPHTNVSDSQKALKKHCIEDIAASDNGQHSQKGTDDTFDTALNENSTEDKAASDNGRHSQNETDDTFDAALNENSTEDKAASDDGRHSQNETDDTFDALDNMNENCFEEEEEEESSETGSTEATTSSPNTESTTAEDRKKEGNVHKKNENHTSEVICKTDFPCSVNGVWYSHIGGVLLSLKTEKNGKLNVTILHAPSYYPGHGMLSECWKITGEIPFIPKMKSFINLKATESTEHKFATFIGECFTCEGEDVIYGSWLFGRPAHSCKDQHISTTEYKDIFRKSHLHKLKIKCKKVKRKPGA